MLCLGQLGMGTNEFYESTLADIQARVDGQELKMRDEWERMRMQAYWTVVPHLDKKSSIKSPADLWQLPWEVKKQAVNLDNEWTRKMLLKMGGGTSDKAVGWCGVIECESVRVTYDKPNYR